MPRLTIADIAALLADGAADSTVDAVREDEALAQRGLDSLRTLNLIIRTAELYNLDLERMDENIEMPDTFGGLVELLNSLSGPDKGDSSAAARAPVGEELA